jgi:hypothetical protein
MTIEIIKKMPIPFDRFAQSRQTRNDTTLPSKTKRERGVVIEAQNEGIIRKTLGAPSQTMPGARALAHKRSGAVLYYFFFANTDLEKL